MTKTRAIEIIAGAYATATSNQMGWSIDIFQNRVKIVATWDEENIKARAEATIHVTERMGTDEITSYYISHAGYWTNADDAECLGTVMYLMATLGRALEAEGIPFRE